MARPELSFRFVASDELRDFARELTGNAALQWVGRKKVVTTLDETFKAKEKEMKLLLLRLSVEHVGEERLRLYGSGTMDDWSTAAKANFCSFTWTGIADDGPGGWEMLTILLDLIPHPHPHTAASYYELWKKVRDNWNVLMFIFTTDGAASMVKAFASMARTGSFSKDRIMRLYCVAHAFNTVWVHACKQPGCSAGGDSMGGGGAALSGASGDALLKELEDEDEKKPGQPKRRRGSASATMHLVLPRTSPLGKMIATARVFVVALTAGSSRLQYVRKLRDELIEDDASIPALDFITPYKGRWWAEVYACRRLVKLEKVAIQADPRDKAFSFSNAAVREKFAAIQRRLLSYLPTLKEVLPFLERAALWTTLLSSRSSPTS